MSQQQQQQQQQQFNPQYEMHTLHSPLESPQQYQSQLQPMDGSQNPHASPNFYAPPPTQYTEQPQQVYYSTGGSSYSHQQQHPALDFRSGLPSPGLSSPGLPSPGLPSPGLPPPGTEPPYTSQPNSPSFPPGPYQQKPDGNFHVPHRIHTQIPHDPVKDSQVPKTPIYTPGSLAGPNGGVHAPGQISHPNQQPTQDTYKHSAWGCFGDLGICCTGYWCPCILYSRTKHRLKPSPNSNLNSFSNCNPHCMVFCVLSPCSWVFTLLQRIRIRENYRLEGSIAGDCARAYCCSCCTLIQDEREVMEREDDKKRFQGPGSGAVGGDGYKGSVGMRYPVAK